MTRDEYETALATYLRSKRVTRCPTVCAVPTQASIGEADRRAYRAYVDAKERQRLERLRALQKLLHS